MKGIEADLRHALRVYRRTPVPSALAVAVLAVAIACVGAFLSLYSDLALKPHAGFASGSPIVTIGQNDGAQFDFVSFNLIERIDEEVASLEAVAGVAGGIPLLAEPGGELLPVDYVTRGFFSDLKPRLALGRGFDERDHDPAAEPVAVVSHRYWQEQFGGRDDVLGQTVRITGKPLLVAFDEDGAPEPVEERTIEYRIVGVMGPVSPSPFGERALWLPFEQAAPRFLADEDYWRGSTMVYGLARLGRNARIAALVAELNDRYGDAHEELAITPGFRLDAMRGVVANVNAQRDAARQVRLFLGGSALLALVAACNVSLFLLSRAPGRRRELAIRMAVGAPLRRLARQLATEAALLVAIAAALGVGIGVWLAVLVQDLAFLRAAQFRDASLLDWRVLALVAALTLALTGLVALAPVVGLKRLGIAAGSRLVTARAGPAQRIAGGVQIAVAGAVAGVAIAFAWYLGALATGDPGYDPTSVHAVSLARAQTPLSFKIDFAAVFAERERRRDAIMGLPRVDAVAFGSAIPGRPNRALGARIPRPDTPDELVAFNIISIDAAYPNVLGIRTVHGRPFDDGERGAMLVNEALARLLWGRTDVTGETLPIGLSGEETTEIVGVLADVSYEHPAADVEPLGFIPAQPFSSWDTILIKSSASTAELHAMLDRLIAAGELDVEIANVERLDDVVSELLAPDRARTWLAAASAMLVVALAAFGFYGTQRYLVSAGRREYAIRAASGAGPRALGRLVTARGLRMGWPGLALGALLAFVLVAWLREDFVSRAVEPAAVALIVLAGMAALLVAASVGPARQARATKPAPLLREE